jgi:hypothetical protein
MVRVMVMKVVHTDEFRWRRDKKSGGGHGFEVGF